MKIESNYYIWTKGDRVKINDYFSTHEFSCQCEHTDCVTQKISAELIEKLTTLRKLKDSPVKVTSGFRCTKHQEDIRNSGVSTVVAKVSQHELGNAADIRFNNLEVADWIDDAKRIFDYIGVAKTFLHLDTRKSKVKGEHVTWKY